MATVNAVLAEFDNEMALTRRVLERAPESSYTWRPHEKSWTLGELCTHLGNIPHWGVAILNFDGYDLVKDAGPRSQAKTSTAEVLAMFDGHVTAARTKLAAASDAELMAPWSLKRDGVVLMTQPRIGAFKGFAVNHTIHHRGQLTVYLRLLNVPVPAIYGPSADEAI